MSSIIFRHFNNGVGFQYGDYIKTDASNIEQAKETLLELMFTSIREIAKDDRFWIVKHIDPNDPIAAAGCPVETRDHMVTIGWKAQFPQMEPEKDYKERMKDEYWQLKDRYNKLHTMCVKYEAGTLDFTPNCSLKLLKEQKAAMGLYLHTLEVRAEIEGITL